ncbi:response regulator transcription factor [Panacibacter sp. DH6]|uniref:Response regulator transcription factor n=1 Tax=Panacibacter microcysteis TaxID=2793269 RepID=A0A931E463_9BACT|nr:response regulator transcription factor [Panacibacter microcysteis]MBG9374960.1 response regulator transcription factor [Panacibacter microcysteis]
MAIKVIVYDDNKDRRESLKILINIQPEMACTGIFKDCLNVWNDIVNTQPDVILMDIDMPEMSGIEGVKMIRKQYPDVKIIMQTVFDDTDKIFAAIEAGADGYFLKTTSTAKIIEGIKEVMEGGAPMTATVAKKVLTKFKDQPKNITEVFELNEQERTILNHLVNGLSYKMIADVTNVSYSAVNMYIKRIYKKLQVHSATEAISKATKNRLV